MWLWKKYKSSYFVFDKYKLDSNKNQHLIEQINNIDYFLIDTNCLIHPVCFKVLADNPELINIDKLETKMIIEVIEYLNYIIKYVEPKKGIFIAIDGVAPIAKIKQQRSRRFKSVHDRILWNNIKKKQRSCAGGSRTNSLGNTIC